MFECSKTGRFVISLASFLENARAVYIARENQRVRGEEDRDLSSFFRTRLLQDHRGILRRARLGRLIC